jgi:hypothetical protein
MHSTEQFENTILDKFLSNMGTVAGVVPADFVSRAPFQRDDVHDEVLNQRPQIPLNDQKTMAVLSTMSNDLVPQRTHIKFHPFSCFSFMTLSPVHPCPTRYT